MKFSQCEIWLIELINSVNFKEAHIENLLKGPSQPTPFNAIEIIDIAWCSEIWIFYNGCVPENMFHYL